MNNTSVQKVKGSYLDQILPQHESLYPIGLLSARIKSYTAVNVGAFLLSKMSLNVLNVKLFLY